MVRRKLQSFEDYDRALAKGFGCGTGANYRPWLRVQDVPSSGKRTTIPGILIPREHHLLSDHEKRFFLIAEHAPRVVDIREQYPLFPLGLPQRIANQIGIRYPTVRGTPTPLVLTTDFLLTLGNEGENQTHLAVAVKPSDELLKTRVREKLELERLFWSLLRVRWVLVTERQLSRIAAQTLEWLSDPLRGAKGRLLKDAIPLDGATRILEAVRPGRARFQDLVEHASSALGCQTDFAAKFLRTLFWKRAIRISLDARIQETGIVDIISIDISRIYDEQRKSASQ